MKTTTTKIMTMKTTKNTKKFAPSPMRMFRGILKEIVSVTFFLDVGLFHQDLHTVTDLIKHYSRL